MPKEIVSTRQNPSTLRGAPQTGQLNIGAEVALLPELPAFNGPAVVAQLRGLNEQAARVLAGANRADPNDEESAAVATDFLSSITTRITEVDDARKAVTGKFDKLVKGLNAMFTTGPSAKLIEAKGIMQQKLGVYVAAERRKAEAAAEAERQRIAAEAAAQAQNALEEGDDDGALEILETAASFEVKVEKPVVRGRGASLASTNRKVGTIKDLRKFLAWVGSNESSMALAVVGGIDVGQKELNTLAATVLAANELAKRTGAAELVIPGFEAGYVESFGAR